MSDIVVFRPGGNPPARDLAGWGLRAAGLIQHGAAHALAADHQGSAATSGAVATSLPNCRAALFFCHGAADKLMARGVALWDSGSAAYAQGLIVIAIACSSARRLGPAAVSAGADAYLGFDDKLVWLTGDPHGRFGDAAVAPVACLAGGGDAAAARAALENGFDVAFAFYRSSPANVTASDAVIAWLAASWNRGHVQLHGNPRAAL